MTENNQNNNTPGQSNVGLLQGLRKKVLMRAVFSVAILLLTLVLLFSMTVAWYTNVADTGGLIFVASKWGFDGEIFVESDVISMAPGDSGIVSMQIRNTGEETAIASVTVSKANLSDLMQKRLYFYVDTGSYRNSERMNRIYVSSSGGYAYTVFPDSRIYVTEDSQNAPALKWEWVYDVLGYYVYGKIADDSARIDEYIRPIEYSFDPVTTTFTEEGYPKTVDGIQTADEFLVQLSQTDGYDGTIDVSDRTENGYYPVYVNSEGYGVWAYLCTYSEIMQSAKEDTDIGASDSNEAYSVEINVTGSNSTEVATNVGDAETLIALIESMGYVNLKLTDDITLDSEVMIKNGHRADIDLDGHTMKSTDDRIIYAEEGSELTLRNGILQGNGQSIGVEASGARMTLSDVVLTDVEEGIKVCDHQNAVDADSRIYIVDSEITGGSDALWVYGNNGSSNTETTVIIERSSLIGTGYAGVICNGSYSNTNIQISDSTVKGFYTSVYHPQNDSILQITRCNLEGMTGIVVKGGDVTINDSIVKGTGTEDQIVDPKYSLSGFSDTGDGIYLEANYEWSATVTVTGDNTVVTSANALAVRKYMDDEENASISIAAGIYSTDVSEYLADGASQSEGEEGNFMVRTD